MATAKTTRVVQVDLTDAEVAARKGALRQLLAELAAAGEAVGRASAVLRRTQATVRELAKKRDALALVIATGREARDPQLPIPVAASAAPLPPPAEGEVFDGLLARVQRAPSAEAIREVRNEAIAERVAGRLDERELGDLAAACAQATAALADAAGDRQALVDQLCRAIEAAPNEAAVEAAFTLAGRAHYEGRITDADRAALWQVVERCNAALGGGGKRAPRAKKPAAAAPDNAGDPVPVKVRKGDCSVWRGPTGGEVVAVFAGTKKAAQARYYELAPTIGTDETIEFRLAGGAVLTYCDGPLPAQAAAS